ncbi:MAG TPA: murein L,D-transpeptidase catalytic domain family protein [Sphingobium sp.]|uniref:murein L,D-transpeptidase catalytic domain family protein n=1 Tax=Sphingobium sp. TaxID=1912891 RepID=UPI002ED30F9D
MSYRCDRRRLLKAGLAGAAMAAFPARLLAANDAGRVVSPLLMDRARSALDGHTGLKRDLMAVVDFSQPSSERRFHIVNLEDGRVDSLLVAHGRGSDPAHSGWLKRFSNDIGSEASSAGAFRTGSTYVGQHGRSRRLVGLDSTNSNAEARAVVVHGAWYVTPALVRDRGKLGRSEGCFAVQEDVISALLDRLGEGRLIYAGRSA